MGKASRRKKQRGPSRAEPARGARRSRGAARPRGRRWRGAVPVAAGLLALAAGGWWLVGRDAPSSPRVEEAPVGEDVFELPDPDTSAMTPPVARAIAAARAAARTSPGSAAAVGKLGEVLHAHWLNDEAAACYERAHELDRDEFRWVYLLAGVEDIRGVDAERIDRLFGEAVRRAPGFAPAYVRHADALMRLGRWAEARDLYRAAVDRDPSLVLAHRGLGQAAVQLREGDAAVEALERAAELAPDDRITQTALARAYALAGDRERSAAAAARSGTLKGQASLPDPIYFEVQSRAVDPESLRQRISQRLARGDDAGALAALELLAESEGNGARRQLAAGAKERANRLAFGGDFDAALPLFARAARFDPSDPGIEHNWGTVLLRMGELEAARPHFERAIELDPSPVDSLYNLGVVLEGLGRPEEALERFRAAAAINPEHVAAERLAEPGGGA